MQIKILILGAANDQIKLIRKAKCLGYFVVVCDFTSTNPGLSLVDKHYQIDYLDKNKVLEVAVKENVYGVISNSEQAMPVVAYVSEQLSLIGNSVDSIKNLADKTRFRFLQKKIGVFSPKHYEVDSMEEAMDQIKEMQFPILIKACECSATRGTFKIEYFDESAIKNAYVESARLSWNNKVALEEFVAMPSLTTYEGDVFVFDGDMIWDGLFYTQRSVAAPMIPMTYSGPLDLKDRHVSQIKNVLYRIFQSAGVRHGQYNVELYVTGSGELFVIEINTRQGGRNLPEFVEQFSGVDLTKLLISTCVGERKFYEEYKLCKHERKYISHHLIFPRQRGKFKDLHVSADIEDYVIAKEIYVKTGDDLCESRDGTDLIGYVDFEFPNQEIRDKYAFCIERYVDVRYQ